MRIHKQHSAVKGCYRQVLLGAGIMILSGQPLLAGPLLYNVNFSTVDQSLYGPGGATVYRGRWDIGPTWDLSGATGGIDRYWYGNFGTHLSGHTTGALQLRTRYQTTSGDVSANVPAQISLSAPILQGQEVTFSSSYNLGDGFGFHVNGPQVGVGVDLHSAVYAAARGESCFFGCAHYGGTLLNFAYDTPIFGYNDNFDGKIKALGYDITSVFTGGANPHGLLTYPIKLSAIPPGAPGHDQAPGYTVGRVGINPIPYISAGVSGDGSTPLSLTDTVNIGTASLDVTNLLAINLGLPPLNDSYGLGAFSYNLLKALLGVGFGAYGNFSLDLPAGITGRMTLVETGDIFDFDVGEDFSFLFPEGHDHITLLPSFDLIDPSFSSAFGLSLSPFVDVSALKVSLLWDLLKIGPLLHENYSYDFRHPPLWNNRFALGGFSTFIGEPMFLSRASLAVPEPVSLPLFGAGFSALAWMRRRRLALARIGVE
jgi:hypothetical protein